MLRTPVLFLIFNREDTTRRVFEAIRAARPARLYVAADGPRAERAGEAEMVRQTRAVIDGVDWPCEVKTLFREENSGCQQAVSRAITWFFEHEERGIILEDDCLPDPSFFPYCEELLERYRDDERIGHISGNCYLPQFVPSGQSYDFASIPHIWGWATWRRVWKNYETDFPFWTKYRSDKRMRNRLFLNARERIYFSTFLSDTLSKRHGINAWSPQYVYTLRLQNQLSVCPAVNLVSNIGLDSAEATHTKGKSHKLFHASSPLEFPLKHPENVWVNREMDRATFKKSFFSYKRLVRYFLKDY
jgi:hypothetical protein